MAVILAADERRNGGHGRGLGGFGRLKIGARLIQLGGQLRTKPLSLYGLGLAVFHLSRISSRKLSTSLLS